MGGAAYSLFLLQPFKPWAWFLQYYLSSTASGWDAMTNSMYMPIFRERISKYMALSTLCNYGSSVVAAPLYAALFDAKATSYAARLTPGLVSFVLYLVAMVVVLTPRTGVWQLFCLGLDDMQSAEDATSCTSSQAEDKKSR